MSLTTPISYRNLVIYQLFVRQFSKTHDFKGVMENFDKIEIVNTDIIYLMPIHPIGLLHRKGSIGSPYSIKDYYEVHEDYGTKDDFKAFLDFCHKKGKKVMIDIVFNHTSHDANYVKTHPEWYYHKEDGSFCNRVGDWWDIIDFNFEAPGLQDELINVLKYWATFGVDGFRCDVAPIIPLTFWDHAHEEVLKINPNIIFLSETVHLGFVKYLRDLGYEAHSDAEMMTVFDMTYDYDVYPDLTDYLEKKVPLQKWVDSLIRQESCYPANYVKIRYLENHDFNRIASFVSSKIQLRNVTTMLFFTKGAPFIFNGQECSSENRPDLFEYDVIDWSKYNQDGLVDIMSKMTKLRKDTDFINGIFNVSIVKPDVLKFSYQKDDKEYLGIFNLGNKTAFNLEDEGWDFFNNCQIKKGLITLEEPLIIIKNK